jgi:hypothetical protein
MGLLQRGEEDVSDFDGLGAGRHRPARERGKPSSESARDAVVLVGPASSVAHSVIQDNLCARFFYVGEVSRFARFSRSNGDAWLTNCLRGDLGIDVDAHDLRQ